ncbi:pancreatic lipase-related protein 2-like [Haemaphysalis longicornis]
MFLPCCFAFLLATSTFDNISAKTEFQHEDTCPGKGYANAIYYREGTPPHEKSRIRRSVRSMYNAEIEVRMNASTPNNHEEVCYIGLGCFHHPGGRFAPFGRLPESPEKVKTKFLLFSRRNRRWPIYLHYAGKFTRKVSKLFNKAKQLVFIIHGYTGDAYQPWEGDLRDALLKIEDMNVILVDWSRGCKSPFYAKAVANTALVGRQMSVLIQNLMSSFSWSVKPRLVHLIGFSMGAHIAGFCGRYFVKATGQKIGRISALDAAGPLFQGYEHQITRKDASYVDAIHTTAGYNVLAGNLGVYAPFGDVDFYPNGGIFQPGCPPLGKQLKYG